MANETYPLSDVPWADARAHAIEQAFGAPATVQHVLFPEAVRLKTPPMHTWVWPDRLGPGRSLLMTEGLSDVILKDGDDDAEHCLELLTIARDVEWAGAMLRTAARALVTLYGQLFVGFGETISLSNPPSSLDDGSALTRFAFLVPPTSLQSAGEALMAFTIRERPLVAMWCTGITERECEMLRADADAFAATLEARALVFDAKRASL